MAGTGHTRIRRGRAGWGGGREQLRGGSAWVTGGHAR
jgi:hypothetical protein